MGYKDKEKQREAKKEWARKHRGSTEGSTKVLQGSTECGSSTEGSTNNVELIGNRLDLIEGELRVFREAFGSINDMLKRMDDLKDRVVRCRERVEALEGASPQEKHNAMVRMSKRREKTSDSKRPSNRLVISKTGQTEAVTKPVTREPSLESSADDKPWRTGSCPKHGRQPVSGRWVCCGE